MGSILSTLGGPRPAGIPAGAATQITTTELPSEFKPFITDIFEKARTQQEGLEYTPYPGARLAPFGPLQEESFEGLTGLARQGVAGAPDTSSAFYAQEALEAARKAGRPIETADIERLTNPYQQQVIDIAKREAERAYERNVAPQIAQQAVAAGSYGGSGAAMLEAEGLRNLQQQLSDIQMKGSAQGYQEAQQAYEQEANRARGLQGFMQQQMQTVPTQALKELGTLQSVGEARQLLDQKALNLGYEDFLSEREFPTRSLQEYQASVRGFPYTPAAYQYTQQTSPTPSLGATLLGAATTGLGIYGQLGGFTPGGGSQQGKASGGQIRGGLSGVVEAHQDIHTPIVRTPTFPIGSPSSSYLESLTGEERLRLPTNIKNIFQEPWVIDLKKFNIVEYNKLINHIKKEFVYDNSGKLFDLEEKDSRDQNPFPKTFIPTQGTETDYLLRSSGYHIPHQEISKGKERHQLVQDTAAMEDINPERLTRAQWQKKKTIANAIEQRERARKVISTAATEAGTGEPRPIVTPGKGWGSLPLLLQRLREQTGLELLTEDEARAREIAQWKEYARPRERQAAITREALDRSGTQADVLLQLTKDELGYARARMEEQQRDIERRKEDLQKTSTRDRGIFKTAQDEIKARGEKAIDIKREAGEAAQKLYAKEKEKLRYRTGTTIGSALLKSAKISEKTAAIPGWQGVLAGMTEIGQNWAEEAEGPLGELDDKERNLRRESFNDLWSNKEELNQLYIDIENNNLAGLERLTNFETKLREAEVNLNIALNDTLASLGEGREAEARANVNWSESKAGVEKGYLALEKMVEEALIARNNAVDEAAATAANHILEALKLVNKDNTAASMKHLNVLQSTLKNMAKAAGINWDDVEWDMDTEEKGLLLTAYEEAITAYIKGVNPAFIIPKFKNTVASIQGITKGSVPSSKNLQDGIALLKSTIKKKPQLKDRYMGQFLVAFKKRFEDFDMSIEEVERLLDD